MTCYRAYDADLPEYAAAIDVYEEEGGQRRTFLHVQEYAAPATIPEHDVRRRFSELLAATREVFGVPQEQIAVKSRERGKGGSKYGRMQQRRAPLDFLAVTDHAEYLGTVRLAMSGEITLPGDQSVNARATGDTLDRIAALPRGV